MRPSSVLLPVSMFSFRVMPQQCSLSICSQQQAVVAVMMSHAHGRPRAIETTGAPPQGKAIRSSSG